MRPIVIIGSLFSLSAFAQNTPAPVDIKTLIAQMDEFWAQRDIGDNAKKMSDVVDQAVQATPDDYEVLWRASRWHFWVGDGLPIGSEREKEGKLSWELGDRAKAKNPDRVEGWYYATVGIGCYSQAIGVVNALFKGLEGKFLERLKKALEIDPDLNSGGPGLTYGRYYFELPWPKYDGNKSIDWYNKVLAKFPNNARGHYYLAATLLKEGKAKEAMDQVNLCMAIKPGTIDAPEERRVQRFAQELKPKIEKELK